MPLNDGDFGLMIGYHQTQLTQLPSLLLQYIYPLQNGVASGFIIIMQCRHDIQLVGNRNQWLFVIGDNVLNSKILLVHANRQPGNGDSVLRLVAGPAGQITAVVGVVAILGKLAFGLLKQ